MEKNIEQQVSETFHTIRTNIGFLGMDREMKVFLVTSSVKGEGKTTVACGIAQSYVAMKKKVLLIDCDLRNPSVSQELGIYKHRGLVDLIMAEKEEKECPELSDYLASTGEYLDVITTGQRPPNPLELVSSRRIELIIKHLRQYYDVILLDTPPILLVSDALALQRLADGILLVVKYGYTTTEILLESKRLMEVVGVKPSACIFNGTPGVKKKSPYYGYYEYAEQSVKKTKGRKKQAAGFAADRKNSSQRPMNHKTADYFRQVR